MTEFLNTLNKARFMTNPMLTKTDPLFIYQAMALFIPVLATGVRNTRDVNSMEELWFMTGDNSPDSMARSVAKAVIRPNHARIASNVPFFVEKQFIYVKTVNSNSSPLDGLGGNG